MPAAQGQEGIHVRLHEELLPLRAALVRLQEGCFQMRAQHQCAAALRLLHYPAHAFHRRAGIRRRGAHGGGRKGRHALVEQVAAHGADGRLALHGIMAAEGVDVHIHKARQEVIPLDVYHILIQAVLQPPANLLHPAVVDTHLHVLMKGTVDHGHGIANQHSFHLLMA